MKLLCIALLVVALGALWIDDQSKRATLLETQTALQLAQEQLKSVEQAAKAEELARLQKEVQRLGYERDRALQGADSARGSAPVAASAATPAALNWFQKRIEESQNKLEAPPVRSATVTPPQANTDPYNSPPTKKR